MIVKIRPLVSLALLAALLWPGGMAVPIAQAVSTNIVISEFRVRGPNGGSDEFIELYNLSATAVNIGGWLVRGSNNVGSVSTRATIPAGVILNPGCHYLLTNSSTSGGPYSGAVTGDQTYGLGITDDGGIAITLPDLTVVDQVGMSAGSAFKEGTPLANLGSSNLNRGYERKPGGTAGSGTDTDNNSADFQLITPSDPQNLLSPCITIAVPTPPTGVGAANPDPVTAGNSTLLTVTVTPGTNPASTGLAVTGDLSAIGGSATQPFFDDGTSGDVTAGDNVFSFLATVPGATPAGAKSLPVIITDAQARTGSTTIPLTVQAVNVCTLAFTPIYAIQGSGPAAAITGLVTTQGVVVGDYEGPSPTLRGFYLQDLTGDGDSATSDGIFVFNGNNNNVNLGDVVRVSGSAGEFQDQTQISSVSSIVNCGTGSVTPVDVTLPVPLATYLERFEGMLVRFPQTLYVTEHFQLGRFGQVVMSSGGRLSQPTNVAAPGAPALALQAANDLNRIIVDDDLQNQNPDPIFFGGGGNPLSASNTLRGGDTATGMVGVLSYTWAGNAASGNAYRLRPLTALGGGVPPFVAANPRPAAPTAVGGTLRVSALNLLNYFNTFGSTACTNGVGGTSTSCRGADNLAEFDRQWPKTVAAILAIDPDVLGVNEIENDGYGPSSAIQHLVDKLNIATAPGTFAFVDFDAATGQLNALGLDAIKVGLIYKPASVTPVGTTGVLNSVAFVNGGDAVPRNRATFAQAFEQPNGARIIVSVNHLKSKGSACDISDALDGQGNCNLVRTNAANTLAAWLASDPTGTGDGDILIMGDLNSYAKEDPVTALLNAGYTNLISTFLHANAYSFVFNGQWGYLDHALGSASIVSQVTGVTEWHINADEPSVLDYNTNFKSPGQIISLYSPDQFRVSDHDPVIVGLDLNAPPTVSAGGPYTVNEGGSVIVSATGSDPNGDSLAYAWDLDNNGSFETAGQSVTFSAAALDGPGSQTIRVQATDPGGLTAVAEATVNVLNVAPTVGPISAPISPVAVNTPIQASAVFTDPGILDTHTALWDWGDGTTGGTVSEANGSGSVADTHTYTAAGVYAVTLTVTDDDGGAGQSTYQFVVVYDPNGGFVTGGGWIDSPAGAYKPDPSLTGRANFGFVAKYKKGASVPDGNTQFQFKAGDLNFHSSSYEWLVVNQAGANAQFKGTGTINGAGAYRFMIWAGDGTPDTFRIKIWLDSATGEQVIYDNGAAQPIGGGSIVVHK